MLFNNFTTTVKASVLRHTKVEGTGLFVVNYVGWRKRIVFVNLRQRRQQ